MKTTTTYRDAAVVLWGEAGEYAYSAYSRIRAQYYPELPSQLPIVIGLTAYGHCLGATRGHWEHGPRISIFSPLFSRGQHWIDDLLTHEMLHAWLHQAGLNPEHKGRDWYDAVNRLSPAVLGCELSARRGADRKSVRIPNPDYTEGGTKPKTIVRKVTVADVTPHDLVARWPQSFRPEDYDWGECIRCPTY